MYGIRLQGLLAKKDEEVKMPYEMLDKDTWILITSFVFTIGMLCLFTALMARK